MRSPRRAVILMVDDDPGDRELTMRQFARSKIRNDMHVVEDGEEAMDYLQRRGRYSDPATSPRPDLVLLDLNLPKLDGREVLSRIRAIPSLRTLPVIVMTVSDQNTDVATMYDLGANAFMVKPVDIGQFTRAVAALQEYWLEIVVLPDIAPAAS